MHNGKGESNRVAHLLRHLHAAAEALSPLVLPSPSFAPSRAGYNVGDEQTATRDLAAAISFVFGNNAMLQVRIVDYSLWGSSAGARVVANIGAFGTERDIGRAVSGPAIVVTTYTGRSQFSPQDPPTFALVSRDDQIADPARRSIPLR